VDWEALLRANEQVARGSDLRAAGLSRHTLSSRLRNGAWQRVLPDIVVAHSGPLSLRERRHAALLFAGEGSMLSHRSAAAIHGLGETERSIEVTIAHGRHIRGRDFVTVHQSARLCRWVYRSGVPVTTVARTVVDLAATSRRLDDVRATVSRVVQQRATTIDELYAEFELAPRQGSALLATALEEVAAGSRSAAESLFLRLVRRARLPAPQLNAPIRTSGGLFYADALWEEERLIVEIDGAAWHLDAAAWRRDLRRQNLLLNAGYRVLRFPAHRLREDPAGVIAEVTAALRLAA
jgi:very-short-patch-repair endonuclease